MTSLRVFATSTPSSIGSKIHPMSEEDKQFWHLLRQRKTPPIGAKRAGERG